MELQVAIVIPCYRVRRHILDVLAAIGPEVAIIIAVDDACPEHSGAFIREHCGDPRLKVIIHPVNQGVGGAVMTGIASALAAGADIIVKIDGDGQMDPAAIVSFVEPIMAGVADYTKGNRFHNPEDVRSMPTVRLIGNAGLSFITKLSSGYWNLFDPTNGYVAIDARLAAALPHDKIERRYLFETDLLFRLGLLRAKVVDIPMQAVYGDEISNLVVSRELPRFVVANVRNFFKRIAYNYFLRDFNIASLELVFGLIFTLFGIIFGIVNWGTSVPATAGTVMIATLPLLTGLLLLISFVNFDIQQIPRDAISRQLRRSKVRPH
jgi:dolichol-phosphate mannosyltransferase